MKAPRKLVARDDRVMINHEFASVAEFIAEYVTNISRSGVFIKTRAPLSIGTKVNLRFTVLIDDLETIEGVGEVVRVQEDGMGVVFVELTSHSQDLVSKLITRRHIGERPARAPTGKPVTQRAASVPPPPPPKKKS
jgi:hypothetical protein